MRMAVMIGGNDASLLGRFGDIYAGGSRACVLVADGTGLCWNNATVFDPDLVGVTGVVEPLTLMAIGNGQLCGLRTDGAIQCSGPRAVLWGDPPDGHFRDVSVGANHSCALRIGGSLECWGLDYGGLLDAPDGHFTAVSASNYYSCAIRADGTVECWGLDYGGLLDAPDGRFTAVSASTAHACAIRDNRTIECWGTFRAPPRGVTLH